MELLLAVVLGSILGFFLTRVIKSRTSRQPLEQNVDYKELWEEVLLLLGRADKLTPEQIQEITEARQSIEAGRLGDTNHVPAGCTVTSSATQETLNGMQSYERRNLEVKRAKKGLPPQDDLNGMLSWHISDVLDARLEAEAAQRPRN